MFKGGILLHNHRHETFSPHDIAFLNTHKLLSIEAITEKYIFRATAPNGYRKYSYDYITRDLISRARNNVDKMIAGMNSIEANKALLNLQSLEIKELCRLLHFKYEIVPNVT